jgi:MFS family permease
MGSSPVPADQAARAKRRILVAASLVCSLTLLDSNIVAVSLPSIAGTLGAGFADIEWVISAYVLSFAALLLAAGSYADGHGRKRTTLIGLVVFAVASGLCGLAQSVLMLDLARALQGVGGSMVLTAALAIINHAFAKQERAKAYAIWGVYVGIAIASGPIVGGVVTGFFGWRWAFLINLPICIALFIAIAAFVDESRDHEAERLDYAGILTFSVGLFLLIWALIDGNALGWAAWPIVERFVGAAVLLVAFLIIELVQKRPMVDFTLFAQSTFLGSAFAMLGYARRRAGHDLLPAAVLAERVQSLASEGGVGDVAFRLADVPHAASRRRAGASLFRPHLADRRINNDRDRQPAAVGARALLLALSCIPSRHAARRCRRRAPQQ